MKKKITWGLFAFLCIVIGLYPLQYLLVACRVGLLNSKPAWLLTDMVWKIAFYLHIVLGGLALLIGWLQFSAKLRLKNVGLHRLIGKIYVIAVLISALSGFYIALFASGGFWPSLGFGFLAIIWFSTTLMAYFAIRNKQVLRHQILMVYSYAACFAAVTLRIWLPLLILSIGDFKIAYTIVAWWCWVPNMLVAYWITKNVIIHK